MKTKNKMLALLEIAIVLCSLFLVASPMVAAEQATLEVNTNEVTTASEDDYVLGVYGNANEDDTIDMRDLTYVKLIFFGKKPETELADAKYDGKINPLDFIQIKLIIVGKEKELTVVDSLEKHLTERIVTVKKPVKRIVINNFMVLEALRSLKVPKDIVVGVPTEKWLDPGFYPEFVDVPVIGEMGNPDIEAILDLNPDVVFLYVFTSLNPIREKLELAGITVFRFRVSRFDFHRDEVKKLGYIFDKEEEAEKYLDWREEILNSIKDKEEEIPEEDKPKVYFECCRGPYICYSWYGDFGFAAMAGGKDIFLDAPFGNVDPEAVIERNPDIIVKIAWLRGISSYDMDAGDTTKLKEMRDEIMSRPELQNVKAVKNGKVYVITTSLVGYHPHSGCSQFIQIAYQAKWFQPELFKDLDPKAIQQEYLTRFQGLDIDLDEKGVFVYPEPS